MRTILVKRTDVINTLETIIKNSTSKDTKRDLRNAITSIKDLNTISAIEMPCKETGKLYEPYENAVEEYDIIRFNVEIESEGGIFDLSDFEEERIFASKEKAEEWLEKSKIETNNLDE